MGAREQEIDQWLARVLRGHPFRRTPASDDASFRRYFRVHREGEGPCILMDAPPEQEDCRPFLDIARRLGAAGVNVPEILAHDAQRGLLLLSDLGSTVYLDRLHLDGAGALYHDALRTLVTMQVHTEVSGLAPYDAVMLSREMALFQEWFLTTHLGIELDARQRGRLAAGMDVLLAVCLEQPRVFVHRDYHSRNLMWLPERNPGVLDFQDAVLGPISYDLVSLLRDVYIAWPPGRVEGWVRDYAVLAREQGLLAGTSDETLLRWFDFTGVQRHLKVAGIFARLFHRDGKARYLGDLPLTLGYLERICAAHRELAGLGHLLAELDLNAASAAATARVLGAARAS